MSNEQTTPAPVQTPPRYVNDPSVREVFADQSRIVFHSGQAVHIELTVSRPEMVGENKSEVLSIPAARLVLSPFAAMQLLEQLGNIVAIMEKQGVLRRVSPGVGTKQ